MIMWVLYLYCTCAAYLVILILIAFVLIYFLYLFSFQTSGDYFFSKRLYAFFTYFRPEAATT